MPAASLLSAAAGHAVSRTWHRLVRRDPTTTAMLAWALISLGSAVRYGVYTPIAIALVSAGVLALTVAVLSLPGRSPLRSPGRGTLVAGCLVTVASTVLSPADRYARGPAAAWSHGLLVAAALGLLALSLLPSIRRGSGRLLYLVLGLAAAAGVCGLRATPRPTIDDWHILQGSARALLHGQNIYGHAWPGAEGHLLPYLPGSAVLLAPFYLVLSDVRYGLLAAMLVAALLVSRLGAGRPARGARLAVPAGLIVVYPWTLYLVEQSWPEPLLLAALVAMVWAVGRGRLTLAVICFAVALATKQTAFILVPFAAIWPAFGWRRTATSVLAAGAVIVAWFALNPHQFVEGAIRYNLALPPRHDSLSLFTTAIRSGHTPSFALVPLLLALALALGLWKLPRTAPGFVFGSAWLMGVFNLLNKQSFFNEWALVVGLIMLGIATVAAGSARGPLLDRGPGHQSRSITPG